MPGITLKFFTDFIMASHEIIDGVHLKLKEIDKSFNLVK
jgi:hypothetical protein